MELRRLPRSREQLPVQLDGPLVPAQPHLSQGMEGQIASVGSIGGKQSLDLPLGLEVQLALLEHLRIIEPGGVVIRRELEDSLEEQLSIAVDLALHGDVREQPHGFDMMPVLEQERAYEVLGPGELPVRQQGGR